MKIYNSKSSVRKPMMYGGGAAMMPKKKMQMGGMTNTFGNAMNMGMQKDKVNKNMAAMGMMYGGNTKKTKKP